MYLNLDKFMRTRQRKSKLDNPITHKLLILEQTLHTCNIEVEKLLGVQIDQSLHHHFHVDSVGKYLTDILFNST